LVVTVHLHTVLQRQPGGGPANTLELSLPDGATVEDALQRLDIRMARGELILVINHRVVSPSTPLAPGDRLDIVPAISGGI
jgi:sulfur carrier protein ThiS